MGNSALMSPESTVANLTMMVQWLEVASCQVT